MNGQAHKEAADGGDRVGTVDLTGRDRLTRNVLSSWGSYFILFIAGFIIPRMIDRYMGQFSLGIWDLCWSVVNYLGLSNPGTGSAITRYVAHHRANSEVEELRRVVSSAVAVQLAIGGFVALCTVVLAVSFPILFAARLESETETARWLITLLGLSLSVEMALGAARGVLVGCHRSDLHNAVMAASRTLSALAMVVAMIAGGGLIALAAVYLVITTLTECFRIVAAYRICPELQVRASYISWANAKKVLYFGGKQAMVTIPRLMLQQTNNVLVATILGPPALAVFSRPIALVRHVEMFVSRFTWILTPTAGALQAQGKERQLRDFLLDSIRYSVAMTLPPILLLAVFGDVILGVWMGPQYANGALIGVLAVGQLLSISQNPALSILIGMNLHGRPMFINLLITLAVYLVGVVLLSVTGWSLAGAGLLLVMPLTVGLGVYIPIYGCRLLGIGLRQYVTRALLPPAAGAAVFGLTLLLARLLLPANGLLALGIGFTAGTALLVPLYWRHVLSSGLKERILRRLGGRFALLSQQ